MKKLFALLLALTMIFSLAATAFASEVNPGGAATETTYTITINNTNEGHIYEAYQIFTGDLSNGVLSNVLWGDGQTTHTVGSDATEVAETLVNAADALALIDTLTLSTTCTKSTYANGVYTISGLAAGYYLVKDQDGSLDGDHDAYTNYIIRVVEDVTATHKGDFPTIVKKVSDINDSTDTSMENRLDSADHDIGDDVPFHIHVTLSNYISRYSTYEIIITDTMSKGLTYNKDAVIKSGTHDVTAEFTQSVTTDSDGNTVIVFTCDNIRPFATNGGSITVDYTAKLNENAVIGSAGNPNKVYLEYSNNPYDDGLGKTPEDKVIVFTYQVDVDKVDKDNNPLKGAEFTLYKKEVDGDWIAVGSAEVGNEGTTFSFKGLDDGIYKLEETVTPAGYNSIDPIEFKIEASHSYEADNPILIDLKATNTSTDPVTGQISFNADETTGSVSTDIVNKAGATLPETGGMGTTLFYIVGGIMVAAAAILLVTKKRMSVEG